ncbi:MAG: hypothetical protein ACREUX_13915 [Burkholderiales bacterium]
MEGSTPVAGTPRKRQARARKDSDGQEAVIKIKVIRERMDELVRLHEAVVEARTDFGEAVKKAAEDSGLNTRAVRAFVKANADEEDYTKHRQHAEQLSLLFDEAGPIRT